MDFCTQIGNLWLPWACHMKIMTFRPAHDKTNRLTWAPNEDLILSYPLSAKQRLRLGECPGWSESLLGAQVILLVLLCCSSFAIAKEKCIKFGKGGKLYRIWVIRNLGNEKTFCSDIDMPICCCYGKLPVWTRNWFVTPGWSTSWMALANMAANISKSVNTFCKR